MKLLLCSLCFSLYILSVAAFVCPPNAGLGNNRTKSTGFPSQVNFVTGAICRVKETSLSPNAVTGSFTFVPAAGNPTVDPGDGQTTLNTVYTINGLTAEDHKYHVHNYGDLFSPDGASVENHFVGTTNTRPVTGPQEVGLLNNGVQIPNSDGASSTGEFPDHAADLTGRNSILGRAIIIHGAGLPDPLAKAAQCVIGWTSDNGQAAKYTETNMVYRASCALEAADFSNSNLVNINGDVIFSLNEWGTIDVKVFASKFPASTTMYIEINDSGDISAANAGLQGNVYQGRAGVQYAMNQRTNVGQVGNTNTRWTFTSGAAPHGLVKAFTVDYELALNGLNSIIGRGLVVRQNQGGTGPALAQCVIGIARDQTFDDPPSPAGIPFASSVPMVLEATAHMLPTSGSSFQEGVFEFKRIAENDGVYPGLRVRYHLVGLVPGSPHAFHIRTKGQFTVGVSDPTDSVADLTANSNGVFSGYYSGRESGPSLVGLIGGGVQFVADSNGVLNGEFVDRSLWLGDYNSIIGRMVAVLDSNTNSSAVALGVVGHLVDSITHRDYPSTRISSAQCVMMPGQTVTGFVTFTQGAGDNDPVAFTSTLSGVPAGAAYGIAPLGDVFSAQSSGYLFGQPRNVGGCQQTYAGVFGDFAANGNLPALSLNGGDSIVGRTFFITADTGTYFANAPAAASPIYGTGVRLGACVVGLVGENSGAPLGSSIHYLPSVPTVSIFVPPEIPPLVSGAALASASVSSLLLALAVFVLAF